MARALVICQRRRGAAQYSDAILAELGRALTPDNIDVRSPVIVRREGVVSAVFSASAAATVSGASVCVGAIRRGAEWAVPGTAAPDGSYALLRVDDDQVELVADAVASRTIWYASTDELFVASTSQRAIVAVLGGFEPNRNAFAWLLSSGTLGPGHAWDRRVRCVGPHGRVVLDRTSWRLRTSVATLVLESVARSVADHRRTLEEAVDAAVANLAIDHTRWILPLSGGVDSRGLLLALQRTGQPLRCVTWGRRAAADDPQNDAAVARRLAELASLPHRFFATDLSAEGRDALVTRFLVAGEGRAGNIAGYLDGFLLWKTLRDEGVEGVIRGDEAFGWIPVAAQRDVRHSVGLVTLADFFERRVRDSFELPDQLLAPELMQRAEESLPAWRDRLYQLFRIPAKLAALTDLKTAYVEVANPLLDGEVLRCVRSLPDALRNDKRLWREIVLQRGPDVPFAKHVAIMSVAHFVRDPRMLELLGEELASGSARRALGNGITHYCARAIAAARGRATRGAPQRLHAWVARIRTGAARRLHLHPTLDPLVFAFRALLISRMSALLESDANRFAQLQGRSSGSSYAVGR